MTLPKKTSCTSADFICGTLSTAALMTCEPSCGAVKEEREPKKHPTGVLAAETMYTAGREGFGCGIPLAAMLKKD